FGGATADETLARHEKPDRPKLEKCAARWLYYMSGVVYRIGILPSPNKKEFSRADTYSQSYLLEGPHFVALGTKPDVMDSWSGQSIHVERLEQVSANVPRPWFSQWIVLGPRSYT